MTSHIDRARLSRVLTFLNDKGGVLKTSLTANVGGLLAAASYRVLLIDLDPQGNLAKDLGYSESSDCGEGLFMALRRNSSTPLKPLTDVRPGLDVLAGGTHLDELRLLLDGDVSSGARDPRDVLAAALQPVAESYDFIIVDTPPKIPTLQNLALGAARWLLIPTRPDQASLEGLEHVTALFTKAREHNPDLELMGVILAGVSSSATRIRREVKTALAQDFGSADYVLPTVLRTSESTAYETRRRGQLVHELEGTSNRLAESTSGLAQDYQDLVIELLTHLADAESTTTGKE